MASNISTLKSYVKGSSTIKGNFIITNNNPSYCVAQTNGGSGNSNKNSKIEEK
jgi:hypothetical protein